MAASHSVKLGEFLSTLKRVPKLIVFDVDFTLWPLHVDCYVDPPFKSDGSINVVMCTCQCSVASVEHRMSHEGGATDVNGSRINLFPDVRDIIANIQECGILIAAASSTTSPKASCELQKVLGIYNKFDFSEIYPRRKFSHFENLKRKSQVDYRDMIFFDDERWNISDITTLGVTCVHITDEVNGLDWTTFINGLTTFANAN